MLTHLFTVLPWVSISGVVADVRCVAVFSFSIFAMVVIWSFTFVFPWGTSDRLYGIMPI